MPEIVECAKLPHDLPSNEEAHATTRLGLATGPKKPELTRAFGPLGYDCRGESGTFTLRRRTANNLTVELELDVGTWSNAISAHFQVQALVGGVGMGALLVLPVAKRAMAGGQYPIGDAEGWRKIVENLAALVAELDKSFVPAVEAAAGPHPNGTNRSPRPANESLQKSGFSARGKPIHSSGIMIDRVVGADVFRPAE